MFFFYLNQVMSSFPCRLLELTCPEDQILSHPVIMDPRPQSAKLRAHQPVNVTKAMIRQWPTTSDGHSLGPTKRKVPAPTRPGFHLIRVSVCFTQLAPGYFTCPTDGTSQPTLHQLRHDSALTRLVLSHNLTHLWLLFLQGILFFPLSIS
jgi:hypothetical protein